MIAEGIVTTRNFDGTVNVAPMGPIVSDDLGTLVLRPFPTSRTYQNLLRTRRGTFHITDDVELLARAALDQWEQEPRTLWREDLQTFLLEDACRWYVFVVDQWDESGERPRLTCSVVERGWMRDFWGFNRAKHAVLEAAILASRLHLVPRDEVLRDLARLQTIVDKTAGPQEQRAWRVVQQYVTAATT